VPSQFAGSFAPSPQSWLGIARELIAGTPVLPTDAVPVDGDAYDIEDTPVFLQDAGIRATMGAVFGAVPGTQTAAFSFGSPAYLDVEGYWLDNIFGDVSTVSGGALGTARALQTALPVGAASLAVGASLGSVTAGSIIQIADGDASEIVVATTATGGTAVSFTGTPCRFAHATTATAALQTAAVNYQHTFNLLNSGTGMPPTHTVTDWTGLTPGVSARSYPNAVATELDLAGDATGYITTKVTGVSWLSAPAASTPTVPPGFAAPLASWAATVTVGGEPVPDVGDWSVAFQRQTIAYWNAQNAQAPYVFPRGPLTVTGGLDYTVPLDESPLDLMLEDGLQPLVISVSNGRTGAAALSMTLSCAQIQAVTAKPVRGETLIGYADTWIAIDNATNAGGSGGLGAATVTLVNAVATY